MEEQLVAEEVALEKASKPVLLRVIAARDDEIKMLKEEAMHWEKSYREVVDRYNHDISEAKDFIEQVTNFWEGRVQQIFTIIDTARSLSTGFSFKQKED